MPVTLGYWIGPFAPVMLMLVVVVTNHIVMRQRGERKIASEASRFCSALAAELRATLDLYKMNLELIEQKADYILSTRSSIVFYKGNIGRLTAFIDSPAIEQIVSAFALNERIEAVIAAQSNRKFNNQSYKFSPEEINFGDMKQMYENASGQFARACRVLEGGIGAPNPLNNAVPLRAALNQFLNRSRDVSERRWSVR